jgi:hypothetical protein
MLFYRNKREVIILLIQLLSYLILIVCGVTLFSKWVFGYNLLNGEQDSSSPRMHHHHGMWMHDDQVHEPYKSNEERIAHEFPPLFPSKVYQIPDAMPHIGDKTDEYAILRREVDGKVLPEVPQQFSFDPMVMQQ